jgi:energy-converting hydrogenase B subunit D
MMNIELIIDLVLVLGTLLLALMCIAAKDLFKAIMLFVSLGLFVTIVWARLQAWDVAIAEAAIGAGLTGALLLATWRSLQSNTDKTDTGD